MVQMGMLETDAGIRRDGDGKGFFLAIFMTLIAGGLLPIFSYYSRFSTWGLWIALLTIIVLFSRELPLGVLLKPVMPYFIWLLCFITWGLIVSPVPAVQVGIKMILTTLIIFISIAIITSRLVYLRVLANAMQWLIFTNALLLTPTVYSTKINHLITTALIGGETYEQGFSRFAGTWGNPNMAGYMCLIAIVLSVWATPLAAWVGRLSSLSIIYFAASRKSLLLLLFIIALNVVIVQRHKINRLLVWMTVILMLGALLLLSEGALRTARTRVAGDSNISRLLDFTEGRTVQAGGETRMDLLEEWLNVAADQPWYGYGFGAMGGRLDSAGRVIDSHLPVVGSHNTYVGVFIEAGTVGFLAFLLMLMHYAKAYFMFRGSNRVRWALLSFLACNIIILVVSHNHLISFEGKVTYALLFLLPTCPALKRQPLLHESGLF